MCCPMISNNDVIQSEHVHVNFSRIVQIKEPIKSRLVRMLTSCACTLSTSYTINFMWSRQSWLWRTYTLLAFVGVAGRGCTWKHYDNFNLLHTMITIGNVLFQTITSFCRQIWHPDKPMNLIYQALFEVSMNKIALWIRVCTDDWAAESTIKASNDTFFHEHIWSCV